MELLKISLFLLALLLLIVQVCHLFTNAIEWVGHRFKLSDGVVGSVLAAVGTALPETLVPIVALVSGLISGSALTPEAAQEIGIGAILGAPFLLSTLAMHVSAIAVFYFASVRKRTVAMHVDKHLFKRDFHYFFVAFIIVFLASFIQEVAVKWGIAIGLLAFYGIYVYRTFQKEHIPDSEFDLEPLVFAPKQENPPTWLIFGQVAASLVALVICAHFFVEEIHALSNIVGINGLVLSLVIVPIATELPEKFNSVVWIGKKKDSLALGNITGAMVFQSCIPTAIGLAFTPWVLTGEATFSVMLCLTSSAFIYFFAFIRKDGMAYALLAGGLFYLVFLLHTMSQFFQVAPL